MNDETCDVHDVTKAASDLVALGCSIGATQLYDSFMQLQFSSIVSSYANEIIQAIDEGIISAWQGVQEIREEYAELSSKALFHAENGAGMVARPMQMEAGAPGVVGPVRAFYQDQPGNIYEGNMAYYSMDVYLSINGLSKLARKPDSMQLFNRNPINSEMIYKQTGKLALAFDALVDAITIKTMIKNNGDTH